MSRKRRSRIAQAPQIDDALNTRIFRRGAEIASGYHVPFRKIGTRSETMHEVIGDGDPVHGVCERFGAQHIAHDQFDLAPPRSSLQSRAIAC
jgi:hypothetical protein